MKLVLDADFFESSSGGGIKPGTLTSVRQIDGIHIFHQLNRLFLPYIFKKRTAEIIGNVVFTVTECPGSAEARHDRAALTADTGFYFLPVDGTVPLMKRLSALKDTDLQIRPFFHQLICRKNASRPRSDDDHIIIHKYPPFRFYNFSNRQPVRYIPVLRLSIGASCLIAQTDNPTDSPSSIYLLSVFLLLQFAVIAQTDSPTDSPSSIY